MTLSPIRPASAGYKVSWVKLKKCILVQALRFSTGRTSHRGSRGIALLFFDYSTRRGEGWVSRPGRSSPPGKTRYPLCRRLGRPQGQSGQVRKISPSPEFDPRTVQPVASRYTDWATGLTSMGPTVALFNFVKTLILSTYSVYENFISQAIAMYH